MLAAVEILSEVGGPCRIVAPWPGEGVGVKTASGVTVQVSSGASVGRGVRTFIFSTKVSERYLLSPG